MLRKILWMMVGLVFALVVAAFIVPMFIRGETFREPINKQLQAATGYNIRINGDVKVRLLPFAKLVVNDVTVANAERSEMPAFLKIQKLDVGVALWPLISGNVEIRNLNLQKPIFTLVDNGNSNNWHAEQPYAHEPRTNEGGPEESAKPAVVLQEIEVNDGVVNYKNTASKTATNLTSLNIDGGVGAFGSALALKASGVLGEQPIKLKLTLGNMSDVLAGNKTAITLTLNSKPLTMSLDGAVEAMTFKGDVTVTSPSLAALPALFMPAQKPAEAPSPLAFSLEGSAICSAIDCDIQKAKITLDDSTLTGSISANYAGKPNINLNLKTEKLDISGYIANSKQAHNNAIFISEAFAQEAARWSKTLIDLSALNKFTSSFSLLCAEFKAKQFSARNVNLVGSVEQGALNANIKNANLFDGTGDVRVSMNSAGNINSQLALANVAVEPLMTALSGQSGLRGVMNVKFDVNSRGTSLAKWVDNLSGKGELRVNDGAIKGVDIAGMVRNVKTAFSGGDNSQHKTDFAELGGSFTINNGIIHNNDLAMKAPLFRLSGKGTIDLPAYQLNYRLMPELVGSIKGQGGTEKTGIAVPIVVSGNLENPSYAPDLAGALEDTLKNPDKLKNTVKDIREQFKGDGGKEKIKELKGLLNAF